MRLLLLILGVVALPFLMALGHAGMPTSLRRPHARTRGGALRMAAAAAPLPPGLDTDAMEHVATLAVKNAGKAILAGQSTIRLDSVTSKIGSRDILTKVDLEAQEVIKATIMGAFPSHTFLGEEDLPPGRDAAKQAIEGLAGAEHLWIVDPVDGTTNFAHGQSLCGVILAYAYRGQVLFGCIYDPFLDELFTAWAGRGAFLNGRRIRCCETPLLQSAVVCTGSPPNLASLAACLRATNAISADVRTMRMLGSASIMLSWLACGRVTVRFAAKREIHHALRQLHV
jgi:myo-inositol-1(or 4)-monophosphatase